MRDFLYGLLASTGAFLAFNVRHPLLSGAGIVGLWLGAFMAGRATR